jgi:hypothetical protein
MKYEITTGAIQGSLTCSRLLNAPQDACCYSGRFNVATDTNSTPQKRNGIRKRSSGAAYGSDLNVDSSFEELQMDNGYPATGYVDGLCGYADWRLLGLSLSGV